MIKKITPLLPSILLTLLFTSLSQSVRYEGDVVDPPQKKYHIVKPNYSDLFDERPGEFLFNHIRVKQPHQELDSSLLARPSNSLNRKSFGESSSRD